VGGTPPLTPPKGPIDDPSEWAHTLEAMKKLLIAAALLSMAGSAGAQQACPGGTFVTYGRPHQARLPADARIVLNSQGEVSLDIICPPEPADVRVTARGITLVRALWPSCGVDGQLGALRIRARITPTCNRMFGFLRDPRTGVRTWFKAQRIVECGDGILEGDEQCDDGNLADGDCCSSTCELEAGCQTPTQ
jgi:cysteine-rich repeat protein